MRGTVARSTELERPRHRDEASWLSAHLAAAVAVVVAFMALSALILFRYPLKHYVYPIGWDAPYYVWRANAVTFDGLARIGAIRAGSPILIAVLMQATGQNAFTMVAVTMAASAAIAGLGAAAMVRAGIRSSPAWVPVVAVLTWLAFGRIGIIGGHLDNALNAAFILCGFAAAVALTAGGRGALATALLFMAAVLAEWPFYAFAMGIFLLGLFFFSWPVARARLAGRPEPLGAAGPLLGAAAVSMGFAALSFLAPAPGGGIGVKKYTPTFRNLLRGRFFERLRQSARYYAFPLAAVGAVLVARAPATPPHRPAKRLFLSLMAAWMVVTVAAALAQVADIPVAGGRLLSFLFAVPILAAVCLCWAGRWLAARYGRPGAVAAVAVGLAAVIGFAVLAWGGEEGRKPFISRRAVRQVATAGTYLDRLAPHREAAFLVGGALAWNVVKASLPADVLPRVTRFKGTPTEFLASSVTSTPGSSGGDGSGEAKRIGIVVEALNKAGYEEAVLGHPENLIASGVVALSGPALDELLPVEPEIKGNTGKRSLLWIVPLVLLYLAVAGGGWAIALLPNDAVIRIALAPGLGAAMMTLVALAWDFLGLRLGGHAALGPLIVATALGWAFALLSARMRRLRQPGACLSPARPNPGP